MRGRTLRLALSMRGGVSLAVWIGGAVAEIDALRWDLAPDHEPDTTMGKVAVAVGTTGVEIDVISGTSAGGLNGVVLGTAMANGTSVEGLRHVWLHTADLAALMRPGGWKRHPSILDSEQFLRRACAAICVMGQHQVAADGRPAPVLPRLEAYFPVTSVVPATTTAWADPLAPVSERRIGGWIWLHHPSPPEDALGPPLPNTATSDFVLAPVGTPEHRAQVDALALTICSTAAFPVAFAPTRIPADVLPKRVRFPDGRRPDPLFLFDGGVVDNMPVGRAVSAISRAPANGPTERVLVYLHPSPGANRGAADPDLAELAPDQRPAPVDVARSAVNVLTGKSLVDDLRGLEDHNRSVRWHLRDRAAALATPPGDTRDEAAIRATVAAHDAEGLASLLWDPTPHLEALGPDGLQDGWLSDVGGERQLLWVRALTDMIRTGGLDLRPWSGVIRTASRLIEWAQWLEASGPAPNVSSSKSGIHALRAGAFREASELDRRTLLSLPDSPATDIPAGAAEVVDRRRQVLAARETHVQVQDAWAILARDAIDLLGVHTTSGAAAEIDVPSFEDALPAALAARLGAVDGAEAELVLRRLDDDLLAVHGHAPTGSLDQVRYHTLAGTAPTPLSTCFPWPAERRPMDPPLDLAPLRVDGATDPLGRLDPTSKLAGNQLMNFAAFLDVSWRANDWMWGRADAADTLIRLLVDPAHSVADPEQAASLIRDACLAPIWPADIDDDWIEELQALARQPWGRDAGDESDTVLQIAAELQGDDPRTLTHAVVAWRRHLEVLAVELSRPPAENPTQVPLGKGRPNTFAEALARWSQPTRTLASRWGRAPEAALGGSAVFLTVRTLLGRTPPWARLIEAVVSPFAGPVTGVVLARRRGVAATVVALAGVTLPRTYGHTVGSVVVTLAIVGAAVGGAWVTRGPGPTLSRIRNESWSLVALLLAAGAVVSTTLVLLDSGHLDAAQRGWLPVPPDVVPERAVAPALAAVLATWWVWFWMRPTVRVALAAGLGAMVGIWAALGDHESGALWAQVVAPFEAIAWCLVAVVLVTSLVGFNVPRLAPRARPMAVGAAPPTPGDATAAASPPPCADHTEVAPPPSA